MRAPAALALLAAVAAAGDEARRADLLSGEWERSNRALDALATERADVAVPLLVEALALDESFLRRRAAQTLALFGKDAAPAVPALIQALYDDDRLVATHAMMALDAVNATEALPFVIEASLHGVEPLGGLKNLRLGTRPHIDDLGKLRDPRSADRIREGLAAKEAPVRAAWVEAVGNLGAPGQPFVPRLRELVADESFEVCGRAAYALAVLGASDAETVAALAVAWRRKETFVRRKVAFALGRIGEPAFPAIAAALGGEDLRMRRWAAFALLACLKSTAPLVAPLCEALDAPDRALRLRAVQALGNAGEHAAPAVPRLVALLAGGDEEVVAAAIDTLGAIGPAAAPAAPRILSFLNGHAHAQAVRALGAIGAPEALPFLIEGLEKGRADAADALGQMGGAGADVLIAATGRPDAAVRRAAVGAISRHRVHTPEAIAVMRRLATDDPDPSVRSVAALYLTHAPTRDDSGLRDILTWVRALKPRVVSPELAEQLLLKAKPATLLALLDDKNANVRRTAALACAKADWPAEDARAVREALTRLLADPDVRFDVASIVAGFKDPATIEPLLRVLAVDEWMERRERLAKGIAAFGDTALAESVKALDNAELRVAAAQVLEQIGPPALEAAGPKLAALVADPEASSNAIRALAFMGSVPDVRDALVSTERNVSASAVRAVVAAPLALRQALAASAKDDLALRRALAEIYAKANDVETLVALARDEDATVRSTALQGLSKHPAQLGVLVAAMHDADPAVRAFVLGCLAKSRSVPDAALPELERLVKTETDERVLQSAARLARHLGAAAHPLVDAALASDTKRLRLFAVQALGPDLRLVPALRDADEDVRVAAAEALSGNAEALDALVRALGDGSERVVGAALRSIEKLGDKAAPAAKVLAERLMAGDQRVTAVLLKIGPPAVPFLIAVPGKERDTLQRILREMGPRAAAPLIELLDAGEAATRRQAAWALGLLGRDAEAAVPALTKALADDGRFVATQAAWALGEIGKGAKSAIPELEKLRKDPAKQSAADDALRKIRG